MTFYYMRSTGRLLHINALNLPLTLHQCVCRHRHQPISRSHTDLDAYRRHHISYSCTFYVFSLVLRLTKDHIILYNKLLLLINHTCAFRYSRTEKSRGMVIRGALSLRAAAHQRTIFNPINHIDLNVSTDL